MNGLVTIVMFALPRFAAYIIRAGRGVSARPAGKTRRRPSRRRAPSGRQRHQCPRLPQTAGRRTADQDSTLDESSPLQLRQKGCVTTVPTHAGDPVSTAPEARQVDVVPSSVQSVLATIISAKGQSSFSLALPIQTVERGDMEISVSAKRDVPKTRADLLLRPRPSSTYPLTNIHHLPTRMLTVYCPLSRGIPKVAHPRPSCPHAGPMQTFAFTCSSGI